MTSNIAQPREAGENPSRNANQALPLLTVRGICKSFQSNIVLRNVSFTVRPGEVLGLIGPNGAGKTTLFECLAGLTPTDAGEVISHGKPLPPHARKQSLFYMPDAIRPWPDQTVGWVASFFQQMYGRSPSESADLLKSLKLDHLSRRRVWMLSKGEAKRLLLALGLLTPQPVLLIDEPFDGLDLRQTKEVMALLQEHARRSRTLFVSIHQLTDAARLCDRLVLLSAGRVVGEGTLNELSTDAGLPGSGLEEVFLALT
ncbi:MAG: transporter related protein [Candidatus Angelobacter sp.]|nr:transporter related protein [Candidatus Angelobacter sp.]